MKSLARIAVVGAMAAAIATTTVTAAVAEDATVYSIGNRGAKVDWVAYGDDMYITDEVADGHSAVGTYQWGETQYFYWNSNGKGTTRYVNLNLTEHAYFAFGAILGDWQGTPTGGLLWNTLNTKDVWTT
ncbi:hypothetical protein SAMN06272735_5564 [Streptomyces sp. TLI_55]|uniref:hypothetical protein n=1 Tax=Streptomyces sp. TLI_55 TaxID=1938861 RepID=UPI000BD4754F|nr:hypothetical protein [Streptomyces sp. TLI_55]SNX63753.1 hypothetical protein SAMN06272735_5564 [Streptomyces sp. TLI_55]